MPELKTELLSGIADFRSLLHNLDGCLSRLVSAEEQLQKELQRIPRFENWEPRRLLARLLPSISQRFTSSTLQLVDRI